MAARLNRALSVLNGLVGQRLARAHNRLATEMSFCRDGVPVALPALLEAPSLSPRIVVLVHGLMATERDFSFADGSDYGSLIARDFSATPLYVRYNSGQAIVESGAQLSALLGGLFAAYPVPIEEIIFIGHSMGGLVVRAACHAATVEHAAWLALVRRAFYLGTPHLGAPLEQVGRVIAGVLHAIGDPYTRLIGQIADLRADGIKDLGDRHPVPLLPDIAHYFVAGAITGKPILRTMLGDSMVPISSATGGARSPEHVHVAVGIGHSALAHHPAIYEKIGAWLRA